MGLARQVLQIDLPPSLGKRALVCLVAALAALMIYQSKSRPTLVSAEGAANAALDRQIGNLKERPGVKEAFGRYEEPSIEQKDDLFQATILFHLIINRPGQPDERVSLRGIFQWDGGHWRLLREEAAAPFVETILRTGDEATACERPAT